MVTNSFGNQSFMQPMNVFFFLGGPWVVFWLLGYSYLFIFTCLWLKTMLRIMCSFKVSTREKGKKKLKKDKKLLEITITISVGVFSHSNKDVGYCGKVHRG
jgi:hypothetical protein